MSTLRPTPVLSTLQFSWCPKTRTFTAEASTLRHDGAHAFDVGFPQLGRVYNDSVDEGFTFVSERTNKEVIMVLSRVDEDDDYSGGWSVLEFRPAAKRDRLGGMPSSHNFKVVIFND